MMQERADANAMIGATLVTRPSIEEKANAQGKYHVQCVGADGQIKWEETIENLVTTQGKNHALDVYLRAQTPITSWFIGLISSVSYTAVAAGDTAAQINGTNGWKEAGPTSAPNYSQGTRPALTIANPASAGSLASSAVSAFSITATGTVKGAFLVSVSTKDGTTGTLYSAGLFSAPGDRAVVNGDTINVSYTASL